MVVGHGAGMRTGSGDHASSGPPAAAAAAAAAAAGWMDGWMMTS